MVSLHSATGLRTSRKPLFNTRSAHPMPRKRKPYKPEVISPPKPFDAEEGLRWLDFLFQGVNWANVEVRRKEKRHDQCSDEHSTTDSGDVTDG